MAAGSPDRRAASGCCQLERLTRINIEDMLEALGLGAARRGRRLVEWACRPPARRFARQVIAYDRLVGGQGLPAAASWALQRLVGRVEVAGLENVPREGPLLVAANHPGLSDTLALFATLNRADLRILATAKPFFQTLPNTSAHLIYLPAGSDGRLAVARQVTVHLRAGGAVLAFPRGEIEPDPAVQPGALESLKAWSPSLDLFARLVPETRVVTAVVSGVLSSAALGNPLARLRRQQRARELLAAMLQVALPCYQDVTVRVAFGPSLRVEALLAGDRHGRPLSAAVVERARALIERPPTEGQTLVVGRLSS